MKNYKTKPHQNGMENYYVATFSWGTIKGFDSEAKMNEWIKITKEKYSFNYEPKIERFKKIQTITLNNTGELIDLYEEVAR